jgi:hypothetical protein
MMLIDKNYLLEYVVAKRWEYRIRYFKNSSIKNIYFNRLILLNKIKEEKYD